MAFCNSCGAQIPDGTTMCAACAGRAQPNFQLAATAQQPAAIAVDKGTRVAGYLIDVIPAIVLGLFGMIPVLGVIIAGLLLSPYWLLRDINGASLGKLMLGCKVTLKDGQPASVGARILRNLPLAVGPAFLIIPLLGYFLGPAISGIAVLVEGVLVLTGGERLGDKIAGTMVIKK